MRNKFFVFSLIFIFVLCFCNICFADTSSETYTIDLSYFGDYGVIDISDVLNNRFNNDVPDFDNAFCVKREDQDFILIYFSTEPFYIKSSIDTSSVITTNYRSQIFKYDISTSVVTYLDYANPGTDFLTLIKVPNNTIKKTIINALYTDSSLTDLVFDSGIYTNLSITPSFYNRAFNYVSNLTMSSIINDLSSSLGLDVLYNMINNVVPLIVAFVLFVFGFFIVRYFLSKINKG